MSNSRPQNFDKAEIFGSTIGFRFHANDEELEEVQLTQDNSVGKNGKEKTDNLIPESLDGAKSAGEKAVDSFRDQWSLLGRRSVSVDSAYESPFSNPIETWKKLNVLKEKITKTVEEKIHEMKIDRNVSNNSKVIHSKENLSISDSEDTSESSKISEHCGDQENQIPPCNKASDENLGTHKTISDRNIQENVEEEECKKEDKNELRNRKEFSNISELLNLHEIKIATTKNDVEESQIDSSFGEDVESGVEADENLDGTEEDSIDLLDSEAFTSEKGGGQGSQNPPGRSNSFDNVTSIFNAINISKTNAVGFLLGFTLYFFFPLSEFFRGFLLSLLLIVFWGAVKSCLYFDEASQNQRSFVTPDYKSSPPLKVPESVPVKGVWFNEYEEEVYDPEMYSVTQTVPAYVELENNILKISRPKGKIHKRATYDEPDYKLPFVSQRVYNINGCNVYLMPDGLTRKRLFSKKYPIVIYLKPDSLLSEKKNGKEVEDKEYEEGQQAEESTSESPKNKCVLHLFARCDRQKEEWYRRILSASRQSFLVADHKTEKTSEAVEDAEDKTEKTSIHDSSSKEASTPFENLFFDDEVNQLEEYFHYMEKFVDVEIVHEKSKVKSHFWFRKQKTKKDSHDKEDTKASEYLKTNSCENSDDIKENEDKEHKVTSDWGQVLWFSAFVNRILFDIFRSPYWLEKIQNKIQRKLNSIRLPYYMEDIEVIEMDLGKNGPMFHRVSQPHLNELGLWFDMDVTFEGLIKLTIQTHLNLIKLQQGIEENEKAESLILEKPKKKEGKRKERIEKESQDSFLIKESKEKIKKSTDHLNQTLSKTSVKSCHPKVVSTQQPTNFPSSVNSTNDGHAGKFIDEVKQLAEVAIEENFRKMKEKGLERVVDFPTLENKRSPIYDSDLEDSAESSDEDEETQPSFHSLVHEKRDSLLTSRRYPKTRRSSKKIFQVFENVARSKYFRTMAQSKYIQRAIAGVSAASLRLTLEIKSCKGILAINVPPPPSDRFWYGFREMPTIVFSVNPKIGDKSLRFIHIKNYLQKKILHEVKKVMVTPNMIDFVLPTSAPARSSSFLNIEEPDLQEAAVSE